MDFICWLGIGGIVGWVASILMRAGAAHRIGVNIAVGVLGAVIGGVVLQPLFSAGTLEDDGVSLTSLVVALHGAVILLALYLIIRFRRVGSSATENRGD